VFSNIPQTFTDLLLVTSAQDTAGAYQLLLLDVNGSSTNRKWRAFFGNSQGGLQSQNETNGNPANTMGLVNGQIGGIINVNAFTSAQIYFPNYRSSNFKHLTWECVTANGNAESYLWVGTGVWEQTAQVSSLTIKTTNNVAAGSSAALYGITTKSLQNIINHNTWKE
jgi:hypothetical protein